jgi:hypothetical protein
MGVELTREQAIAMAQSGWWKDKTPREIVAFQLYEDKLCMDFGDFHAACEASLGRGVWTHEFARPESLRAEFEGKIPKADWAEIVGKIPNGVQVIPVIVESA